MTEMSETLRVVARFLDGKLLKGTSEDFFPNRPLFHIQPADGGPAHEVQCRDLKAIFFVRDFAGDPNRHDIQGFVDGPGVTARGKKIAVRFKDGELVCGYTLTYTPERKGFFMFPADEGSNNLRIYVMTHATASVKAGPQAEAMAKQLLKQKAA